ncbi:MULTISPECIES: flagella synthesis protein FlgN [unclassified Gilliamella]|uniref:flagella synthesis protein FlgN n=1 Tax=unclassified Gilliamella TaxID=2685620 RepID=UPI00226A3C45|nr:MULTISPECIES: flagellar export chaperone FlgN [unclassified Gilliamella]MCX8601728.1 flagellar export chaperone FlgN [Gilliamella sp. B3722]MCX8608386.1 flagellar export chaperone FlgN [Gilliamella sp. B3771]MCX8610991.1 flagellar export chaperone FlgN [Gilliamella sp. B3891]MCX8613459.1 flagellar export chaperone FlgN [Gilliamella sp. B3773]MCX8616373.1 flagellar export chaperone FlgN [Gilliamella sp. B3770]
MLELDNILTKVTVMLHTLSDILQTEQQILTNKSSINQLNEIINQKSKLLIELKLLDEQRIKVSKQFEIQTPYSQVPELAKKWQKITETTKQLAQINRDNGMIIQNRLNITEQTINHLRSLNNPVVYTNNGYQQNETISSKRAKV